MQIPRKSRTFIRAFYAYAFLFDFILSYAIYTAWFELNGAGYLQIGIMLAFWSGSALILEIFTGALSDYLDRRWLMIAAPLFKSLTFVCWVLADGNVWMYGAGFGFWSLGGALYSGTAEALLFERLQADGTEQGYDRYYGRTKAAESLGVGSGILLGGFVAAYGGMHLTLWLSLPPLLLAAVVAFWLRDTRRERVAMPDTRYLDNIRLAFRAFRSTSDLRFVTLYIAFGLIIFEELEEFDQLYYTAVSLPLWLFGVAGAVGLALHAGLSITAHRMAVFPALAWVLPGLGGVLFVVAALGTNAWFVVVLELAYLMSVPPLILANSRFQHLIDTSARATTTSLLEFLQNVTGLTLAVLFGLLAQLVGILPAYGWAGVTLGPIAGWVWWQQRRGHHPF